MRSVEGSHIRLRRFLAFPLLLFMFFYFGPAAAWAGALSHQLGMCRVFPLHIYDNKSYDREQGSHDYTPYAIASLTAYGDSRYKEFTLDNYKDGWRYISTIEYNTGLRVDYYFRNNDSTLDVLLAFRGTRSGSFQDWFSNLSWFTRVIPIENEYDSARRAFEQIAAQAFAQANGKVVRFVTTGHSLGGGLAQHVALGYPCVSAAVFDTSCVTDEFKLTHVHYPLIVSLHQEKDELTGLCRAIGLSNDNGTNFRRYSVDYISKHEFQHDIEGFSVGMLRGVAECQRDKATGSRSTCAIPAQITSSDPILQDLRIFWP